MFNSFPEYLSVVAMLSKSLHAQVDYEQTICLTFGLDTLTSRNVLNEDRLLPAVLRLFLEHNKGITSQSAFPGKHK